MTANSGSSSPAARAARSAKALLLVGCGLRGAAGCLLVEIGCGEFFGVEENFVVFAASPSAAGGE